LHKLTTSFVLGYHGCDRAVAHALIGGDDFRYETNEWDWLGSGVYFWESNPLRGIEYAYELKAYPRKTKGSVSEPAVVGAVIDLGLCLDLTSSMGIRTLKTSYEYFVMFCRDENRALPTNKGGPDRLMRNLDCAVVNPCTAVERPVTCPRSIPSEASFRRAIRSIRAPAFAKKRTFRSASEISNASRVCSACRRAI